jgi:hypothetical protein
VALPKQRQLAEAEVRARLRWSVMTVGGIRRSESRDQIKSQSGVAERQRCHPTLVRVRKPFVPALREQVDILSQIIGQDGLAQNMEPATLHGEA